MPPDEVEQLLHLKVFHLIFQWNCDRSSARPFFVCTIYLQECLSRCTHRVGRRLPSVEGNSLHLLLRQTPVRICHLAISSGEAVKSVRALSAEAVYCGSPTPLPPETKCAPG